MEFVGGRIVAYDKRKPTSRMLHIDYGLGVFSHRAFGAFPADEPYELAALYRSLLEQGELAACEVTQRFYEIGSIRGLEETRKHLARHARLSKKWTP